ncbi:unnamed protein product [Orchesella dallaii]|uniref:Uncharacterized protein n=1 Tax=Orchesella dallaii TaxID=48710 RepID=A0ABP1RKG5_9HEXA
MYTTRSRSNALEGLDILQLPSDGPCLCSVVNYKRGKAIRTEIEELGEEANTKETDLSIRSNINWSSKLHSNSYNQQNHKSRERKELISHHPISIERDIFNQYRFGFKFRYSYYNLDPCSL